MIAFVLVVAAALVPIALVLAGLVVVGLVVAAAASGETGLTRPQPLR